MDEDAIFEPLQDLDAMRNDIITAQVNREQKQRKNIDFTDSEDEGEMNEKAKGGSESEFMEEEEVVQEEEDEPEVEEPGPSKPKRPAKLVEDQPTSDPVEPHPKRIKLRFSQEPEVDEAKENKNRRAGKKKMESYFEEKLDEVVEQVSDIEEEGKRLRTRRRTLDDSPDRGRRSARLKVAQVSPDRSTRRSARTRRNDSDEDY